MGGRSDRLVDVEVDVLPGTEKAYHVRSADTGASAWVPKSQAELDEDAGVLTLPEWLAVEKELV